MCGAGGDKTTAYIANGALMAVAFFGCRIVLGALMLYQIFVAVPQTTGMALGAAMSDGVAPVVAHIVAPLAAAFYVLNIYWMCAPSPQRRKSARAPSPAAARACRLCESRHLTRLVGVYASQVEDRARNAQGAWVWGEEEEDGEEGVTDALEPGCGDGLRPAQAQAHVRTVLFCEATERPRNVDPRRCEGIRGGE